MSRRRFQETGQNSFFGHFVYDRVVPRDHFLRQLRELIPWERFTEQLLKYYRGGGQEGRPPYDPALLLRMLLLSFLYDLSERQTEQMVNEHIPMKFFVGLAVDEKAPDHSTLTAFKTRLMANGGAEALEEILQEIVRIAQEKGVVFGSVQVVDSVHTVANVNLAKEEERKREGEEPRDPGARWGVKGTRRVRTEGGKVRRETEYFYGYKAHVSLNAATGLITSVVATAGNVPDGKVLPRLVEKDLEQGIPVRVVSGDRGYDDVDNHLFLWSRGMHSAIRLKAFRTKKKDPNKEVWQRLLERREYWEGQRERYKVEQKFGEAKERHGLRRCRYVGWLRFALQAFLTAVVLNLKRLVKLLTGARCPEGAGVRG
ncbi:MAG: IS5 family transposase [Anaerolineae bacterium]|nr:IS5 family transposase [Anaerolineae bacterium]